MKLAELAQARQRCMSRISWPALFIRSWGLVCSRNPTLLRTWRNWPWSHIFQHRAAVATLAMNRQHQDEDWLFWGRLRSPETQSLGTIQDAIDRFSSHAPEKVFRQQLQMSRLPSLIRRLVWWWNLEIAGEKRARRIGSFFLTTVSSLGAEIQHPPGVMTTGLTYGPLDGRGVMRVTLIYDHRLMDGAFVASRMAELEEVLNGPMLEELAAIDRSETVASGQLNRRVA